MTASPWSGAVSLPPPDRAASSATRPSYREAKPVSAAHEPGRRRGHDRDAATGPAHRPARRLRARPARRSVMAVESRRSIRRRRLPAGPILGNAYRFSVTDQSGSELDITPCDGCVSLVLRAPEGGPRRGDHAVRRRRVEARRDPSRRDRRRSTRRTRRRWASTRWSRRTSPPPAGSTSCSSSRSAGSR